MSEEKVRLLKTLGFTADTEKLKRVLQFSLSVSCHGYLYLYYLCLRLSDSTG